MAELQTKNVEGLIVDHLENNGQKLNWLAAQCKVSVSHLHLVLKGKNGLKRALTDSNLKCINKALGTKFKK